MEPLRRGIVTFLTASQLDLIDKAKAATVFEEARAIAAQLPEPAASLMKAGQRARREGARGTAAAGARGRSSYPDSLSADHSAPPRAPVFLLHGADDTVIPSVESLLLAQHLEGKTQRPHAPERAHHACGGGPRPRPPARSSSWWDSGRSCSGSRREIGWRLAAVRLLQVGRSSYEPRRPPGGRSCRQPPPDSCACRRSVSRRSSRWPASRRGARRRRSSPRAV